MHLQYHLPHQSCLQVWMDIFLSPCLKVFRPVMLRGSQFLCVALLCPTTIKATNKVKSIMDEAFSVALLCSAVVSVWGESPQCSLLQATTPLLFIQRGMSMLTQISVYNNIHFHVWFLGSLEFIPVHECVMVRQCCTGNVFCP